MPRYMADDAFAGAIIFHAAPSERRVSAFHAFHIFYYAFDILFSFMLPPAAAMIALLARPPTTAHARLHYHCSAGLLPPA